MRQDGELSMSSELPVTRALVSLLHARDLERERLAGVLHDEVGQILAAVGLRLHALRMELEHHYPQIGTRTAELQQILEEAMNQIRAVSHELKPGIAERAGLEPALRELIDRVRDSFRGNIFLEYSLPHPLPREVAGAMYRVIEPAVENSIRHSSAARLQISVSQHRGGIRGRVADDGVGFDPASARGKGLGLLLLRHYARQSDFHLTVRSAPGAGSILTVYCPARHLVNSPVGGACLRPDGH